MLREFIAEVIGTCFILMFGCGVVAMTLLFSPDSLVQGGVVMGGYTNIVLGWALGVSFGVIVSIRISGAHLNPAVTLALSITNRFDWKKVPLYITAQVIGAMLGAAIVFAVFYAKWIQFDPNLEKTMGIFSTFPAVNGFFPGFFDQVIGTGILVYLILALGNFIKDAQSNISFPFLVGAIVLAIGISFGGMNGYAINPARDFGPRLFGWLVGFKNTGFNSYIFIIPIVGPILGGILGAWLYDFTIKE